MAADRYSAGIMSQSFWFIEFRKLLQMVHEGREADEIKREIVDNNLFGLPNEYRTKRVCAYLMNRYARADEKLISLFFSSDIQTQKLINLICILRGDRLFFEFINEVYREKSILGAEYLEPADGRIFMKNKEIQSETIEAWTDTTKKRVLSCYFNFLTDCGMLTVQDGKKKITMPILAKELEGYLAENNEMPIAKAITGVY